MILLTKLQIPEPPYNLVLRPRLAARLNGWERVRLIAVTAPAGYGKTTFASSWGRALLAQDAAVLGWVALDEDDNDPVQFISYLAAALEPAARGLLAAMQEIAAGGQLPPKQVAGSIINALSQSQHRVILVLDDYHLIQTPTVHELLDMLLERAPGNFHCLLLARRTPPLALSRYRVRGQLLTVGVNDLKFTLVESQAFFNAALPQPLNEQEIALITERMDGWGAGMQLAALALRETIQLRPAGTALPLEQEMVAEYIVAEMLERVPECLRTFLLQTAVLEDLSPSLCAAVTLQADSAHLLARVAEGTALVTPLDPLQGIYRYHHLLRHVLRGQLELRTSAAERSQLHRRAAAWYTEAGDVDSALRHYEQGGDTPAALALVERHSMPAMLRGDTLSVERWLARLPAQAMRQSPRLALNSAWLSLIVERTDLPDKLNVAQQALATAPSTLPAEDSWPYELLVLEACAAYYQSQAAVALALAQRALDVIPSQYALERGTCHLLHLICIRQHIIAEDEIKHADETIANYTRAGFPVGVVSTMRTKALVLYDKGQAAAAVQTFYRLLEFARNVPGQLGIEVVYSHLDFGLVLYALNRIAEARQQFELLLEASRRINDQAFSLSATQWLQLCSHALNPQLPTDQTNLAQEEASLCEIFATRSPALAWHACRASVMRRLSEHNPAGAWAAIQCTHFNVHQEPAPGKLMMFVIYAHAYLARGRALGALVPHLGRWEALLEGKANLIPLKIQFRILAALLYSTQGNHMGARKALDEALTLIAQSGYVRFALDYAELLRPLLERSSQPLAQSILAEAETVKQGQAAPLLSEVELRVLRHVAAGATRQETAATLFLSENTIKTHLKRIYGKLGAASRDAALAKARTLGLLDA